MTSFLLMEDGDNLLQEDGDDLLLDTVDAMPEAVSGDPSYLRYTISTQSTLTMDAIGQPVEATLYASTGDQEILGIVFLDIDVGDADFVRVFWRYGDPPDEHTVKQVTFAEAIWTAHHCIIRPPDAAASLHAAINSTTTTATARVLVTLFRSK